MLADIISPVNSSVAVEAAVTGVYPPEPNAAVCEPEP